MKEEEEEKIIINSIDCCYIRDILQLFFDSFGLYCYNAVAFRTFCFLLFKIVFSNNWFIVHGHREVKESISFNKFIVYIYLLFFLSFPCFGIYLFFSSFYILLNHIDLMFDTMTWHHNVNAIFNSSICWLRASFLIFQSEVHWLIFPCDFRNVMTWIEKEEEKNSTTPSH